MKVAVMFIAICLCFACLCLVGTLHAESPSDLIVMICLDGIIALNLYQIWLRDIRKKP